MTEVLWLGGSAPAFDRSVVTWLNRKGVQVHWIARKPRRSITIPGLTRLLTIKAYWRNLAEFRGLPLVLPYLAGDTLLLAGLPGHRRLGAALGSDVLRRHRSGRSEKWFRHALLRFTAVWAVSPEISECLGAAGRRADWVASVGVDIGSLPAPDPTPEPNRIFSARVEAPVYRKTWIRAAATKVREWTLVEPDDWSQDQMMKEYARAQIVVSLPVSDGAPATIMEALCMGAHVVASGGDTVRRWLADFGGTYVEPSKPSEVTQLLRMGLEGAAGETPEKRAERARTARRTFSRDEMLAPLMAWLEANQR
jgi:hypothetical protein